MLLYSLCVNPSIVAETGQQNVEQRGIKERTEDGYERG